MQTSLSVRDIPNISFDFATRIIVISPTFRIL